MIDKPRYESSVHALQAVEEGFNYWSSRITESSFQMCVAIIAANWAVYPKINEIKHNPYALWSIMLVLATIAVSLISAWRMSEAHREQCERAEREPRTWNNEYAEFSSKRHAWPFTDEIENLGWVVRGIKTFLPLLSGGIFIYGVLTS
jgi:hypothetical protein